MAGSNACMQLNAPVAVGAVTRSKSAGSMSANVRRRTFTPAL